jgi:hypothetical protein
MPFIFTRSDKNYLNPTSLFLVTKHTNGFDDKVILSRTSLDVLNISLMEIPRSGQSLKQIYGTELDLSKQRGFIMKLDVQED